MRAARCGLSWLLLGLSAGSASAQRAAPDLPPQSATQPAEWTATSGPPEASGEPSSAPAEGEVPAEEAAEDEALLDAELAALAVSIENEGLDTAIHFGGFMDVNVFSLLNPSKAPLSTRVYGDESTIFVGHLNAYATKNITEYFSMMAELRFMYSPNGAQSAEVPNTGTSYSEVLDYAGSGSSVRWGGIVVERAYGEWSPSRFLTLRIGAFLTPYGIWNVDHGSPVYIPVTRPYAVTGNFFPERQTGLEALGRWSLSASLTLRYHLTLSNGLGPLSEYRDLDDNKALGGRLALEYMKLGTLQLGGSAFYGKDTRGDSALGVNDTGTGLELQKTLREQAYVTSLAADLAWKYRGIHVQGEWVGQRLRYTRAGRTRVGTAGQIGVPVNALAADVFGWAGYLLVGYRLPWWGIMPFATLEYQRSVNYGIFTKTSFSKFGVNIRPADPIVFKVEYEHAFSGTPGTEIQRLSAQLAWAF